MFQKQAFQVSHEKFKMVSMDCKKEIDVKTKKKKLNFRRFHFKNI